jgi:hypothetical protein
MTYLLELLKALSHVLKRRAIEFLKPCSSDINQLSITRDRDITRTTSRDAALQEIDSLAKKVGLA